MDLSAVAKIFTLAALAFAVALLWTPLLRKLLAALKLSKTIRDAASAPIMAELHKAKAGTPAGGGMLVWVTVLALALALSFVPGLNFLSREQTWLPLAALVASALVGLVDDWMNARRIGPKGGGLRVRHRLILYTGIALVGALWFYYKLGWDFLHVPFWGNLQVGWWYIPIFVFVVACASNSVNETDGLDGLAGGVLLSSFSAFAAIAFIQGKADLAAFCAAIVGAMLAFLWHNINPAKFFMGDTGAMGLGVTLGVVAMLTNAALLLPVIGAVLVLESASVIIQVTSKKLRGKKVFKSAPIHHHFEASGWTEPQSVMRLWIMSAVGGTVGLVLALVDRALQLGAR